MSPDQTTDVTATFDHVMSPLELARFSVPNRTVMTAHRKGLDIPHPPGVDELAYLEARAAGGVGLIVTEASPVHPTSFPHTDMTTPYDEEAIPRYRSLADGLAGYETKLFGQIYHCGAQAFGGMWSNRPLWAPSEMRGLFSTEVSHAMTKAEIDELLEAFGSCARNLQKAGFDGVEVHAGHGYLIEQFFSPLTNRREDSYGGSLDNRVRFALETIASIRDATGPDFPIAMRISADERMDGGLGVPEMAEIAARLTATGELDYLSVSNGTHESYDQLVPSGFVPMGEAARYGAEIKPHVDVPVLAVGRIHEPELAEALVADGKADLVGMLRALIADPDLPRRMRERTTAAMRPCIAVNYCLKRVHQDAEIRCAVNPVAGREGRIGLAPAGSAEGKVVVVGAGPAGLEAASTAAEQGFDVTLYTADPGVGGQLRNAEAFPAKKGLGRLLAYWNRRLEAGGVEVRTETRVADLAELGDDLDGIVVATGTSYVPTPWADRDNSGGRGWAGPELFDGPWRQIAERDLAGRRVVLIEAETVDFVAVTLADDLVGRVGELHVVSSGAQFAAALDRPTAQYIGRKLRAEGARLHSPAALVEPTATAVVIRHFNLGETRTIEDVDLVISTGKRSAWCPADSRADGVPVLYAGDCVAPRGIGQAVQEGWDAVVALSTDREVATE
jgi:2,4-dienoyl-CoA reductase-like NADH-dependent reductase (Old Yellow Enzyme family)